MHLTSAAMSVGQLELWQMMRMMRTSKNSAHIGALDMLDIRQWLSKERVARQGMRLSVTLSVSPPFVTHIHKHVLLRTKFPQIRFSASQTIKEVLLSCFEVKRGPGKSVVAQYINIQYSVPKNELIFCSDHWGGPFGFRLHETSSYVI